MATHSSVLVSLHCILSTINSRCEATFYSLIHPWHEALCVALVDKWWCLLTDAWMPASPHDSSSWSYQQKGFLCSGQKWYILGELLNAHQLWHFIFFPWDSLLKFAESIAIDHDEPIYISFCFGKGFEFAVPLNPILSTFIVPGKKKKI